MARYRSTSERKVGRVALTRAEAAAALGVSLDTFERHIQHELRLVRIGRCRLVPVRELEDWVADHAALAVEVVD